jgi:hypothetical protein
VYLRVPQRRAVQPWTQGPRALPLHVGLKLVDHDIKVVRLDLAAGHSPRGGVTTKGARRSPPGAWPRSSPLQPAGRRDCASCRYTVTRIGKAASWLSSGGQVGAKAAAPAEANPSRRIAHSAMYVCSEPACLRLKGYRVPTPATPPSYQSAPIAGGRPSPDGLAVLAETHSKMRDVWQHISPMPPGRGPLGAGDPQPLGADEVTSNESAHAVLATDLHSEPPEGSPVARKPALRRKQAAIKLADVIAKTLASILLPGPPGTFVGEALGKGLEALSDSLTPEVLGLARQIEDISLDIASASSDPSQFPGVASNDLTAAALAVADTISAVPIDLDLVLKSNYSPVTLARHYRVHGHEILVRARLGQSEFVYERVLDSASRQIISVLRHSSEAHATSLAQLATQLQALRKRLDGAGELLNDLKDQDLEEYLFTYRLDAATSLRHERHVTSGGSVHSVALTLSYVPQSFSGLDDIAALMEYLHTQRKVIFEAGPGLGKTMAMRQVFIRALSGRSAETHIPIYIDFHDQDSFPKLEHVPEATNRWLPPGPPAWVDRIIRDGRGLVLLDNIEDILGTSELLVRNQADFDTFISDVATDAPVLIAIRQGTLSSEWAAQHDFRVIELQPPGAAEALEQISLWHKAIASQCEIESEALRVLSRGQELYDAVCLMSDLLSLSLNPLICSTMCASFLDSSLRLPEDWISLVDDTFARLADRDCRASDPVLCDTARIRDIQETVAGWAVRNDGPFDRQHVSDGLRDLVAGWDLRTDIRNVTERILSRTSLLSLGPAGVSFALDVMRDHLAARDLVARGNINYLVEEARRLSKPRLAVAAAGRAHAGRDLELIARLLDEGAIHPDVGDAMVIVAARCARVARSVDHDLRERLKTSVGAVFERGASPVLKSPTIAPLALEELIQLISDGNASQSTLITAVDLVRSIGITAYPALQLVAPRLDSECQELLWSYWSEFDLVAFAQLVLKHCLSVPSIVLIDHPDKFALLIELPRVHTAEIACEVDAGVVVLQQGLTLHVRSEALISSIEKLPDESRIVLIDEGGDDVRSNSFPS